MGRIVVPFDGGRAGAHMLALACQTAGDWGDETEVEVAYVLRIPPQVPISADLQAARERADAIFARAAAVAAGVATPASRAVTTLLVEARHVGSGLVAAAEGADLLMMGLPDRRRFVRRVLFTPTLRYVLAHAPCEVLVGYVPPVALDLPVSRFLRAGHAGHAGRAAAPPRVSMPDNVRVLRVDHAAAPPASPYAGHRTPTSGAGHG